MTFDPQPSYYLWTVWKEQVKFNVQDEFLLSEFLLSLHFSIHNICLTAEWRRWVRFYIQNLIWSHTCLLQWSTQLLLQWSSQLLLQRSTQQQRSKHSFKEMGQSCQNICRDLTTSILFIVNCKNTSSFQFPEGFWIKAETAQASGKLSPSRSANIISSLWFLIPLSCSRKNSHVSFASVSPFSYF